MNEDKQAYNIAVQVVAGILTVGAWGFTFALLAVDAALLLAFFSPALCIVAVSSAWFYFFGFILGKSRGVMFERDRVNQYLDQYEQWAKLGSVFTGMPEGHAMAKEEFGQGKTRYWLLHESPDGTWHKADSFDGWDVSSQRHVADFASYRKSKMQQNNDHEGA